MPCANVVLVIVGMHRALQDGATGALDGLRQRGLVNSEEALQEQYWCTLCEACFCRRTAVAHKKKHLAEAAGAVKREAPNAKLDEKYGDFLSLHAFGM
jgi:hypothetical protein